MRTEASLRRLAEMGVDVYLPRAAMRASNAARPVVAEAHAVVAPPEPTRSTSASSDRAEERVGAAEVLLLADSGSPVAKALLADVARTLKFAHIACAHAGASEEAAMSAAVGLVMFGDAQARAVGALLPAQRQRELGWVVGAELPVLAGDARAKRALWSELRRMTRSLLGTGAQTLATAAVRPNHRGH
jgi:hypothetical protein